MILESDKLLPAFPLVVFRSLLLVPLLVPLKGLLQHAVQVDVRRVRKNVHCVRSLHTWHICPCLPSLCLLLLQHPATVSLTGPPEEQVPTANWCHLVCVCARVRVKSLSLSSTLSLSLQLSLDLHLSISNFEKAGISRVV